MTITHLELRVAGNEISFAVHLHDGSRILGRGDSHQAFSCCSTRLHRVGVSGPSEEVGGAVTNLLGRGRQPLPLQRLQRGIDVPVAGLQRGLDLVHGRPCAFTELVADCQSTDHRACLRAQPTVPSLSVTGCC